MRKKKEKAPKKVKIKVEKPYNAGTFSQAAFWNFIRQSLRRRTLVWKPIQNVRKAARRPYIGTNKRRSVAYECFDCKKLFASTEVNVHHILGAGKLTCGADIQGFIERLFCEEKDLVLLCESCHSKRHEYDNITKNMSSEELDNYHSTKGIIK